MDRPVLVGWSCGATVAVHWADRNPGCAGVVAVDDYRAIADAVRELAATPATRPAEPDPGTHRQSH